MNYIIMIGSYHFIILIMISSQLQFYMLIDDGIKFYNYVLECNLSQ